MGQKQLTLMRIEQQPNMALQLTRAARGALRDQGHFENQYRLIEAFPRRGQLNAKPLDGGPSVPILK